MRLLYLGAIPFLLMHLAAVSVFFVPFEWKWLALTLTTYVVLMFGVVAGYHRYFSHRTYKMGRVSQFLMAFLAQMSVQKGVLWWAAHHRHHHKHSDGPEDLHSPLQHGTFYSHVGWIFHPENDETRLDRIADFAKYPELVWLDKHYWVPPTVLGVAMFALGGAPALAWGFFFALVLVWHGTFTINSLSHVFGTRRYETTDTSRNNPLLALITLGEGWHNNHHCYQSSTNQGFFWWEFDPAYFVLRALSWVGITWDLRTPPLALLEAKRIRSHR